MSESKDSRKKKKNAGKWILIVSIALVALIIAAFVTLVILFEHYYSRSNYVPDPESIEYSSEFMDTLPGETTIDPDEAARIQRELEEFWASLTSNQAENDNGSTDASSSLEGQTDPTNDTPGWETSSTGNDPTDPGTDNDFPESQSGSTTSPAEKTSGSGSATGTTAEWVKPPSEASIPDMTKDESVIHVVLVGVDRRNTSWNGNSDTMIICSINRVKKTITLTSLMRDTAVSIPGVGVRKLNNAFAVGGGPLLVRTIQSNFQIPVSNYAWIDFNGMRDVVEIVGGVDVYLSVAEAKNVGIKIDAPQVVHLNGTQAVSYARDRKSGGNDYMRTQRQRNVLIAIFNKAKSGSLGDLGRIADQILPYLTHNMDRGTVLAFLSELLNISSYSIQEQRIPYDGLYRSSNELLIPNYAETVRRFFSVVY